MPFTLVFTTGPDLFQALVNLNTASRATHAAIGIGPALLHAYENGVLLEARGEWFGRRKQKLIAEYAILPDVREGVSRALDHVGQKYDGKHVVKIAFLRRLTPLVHSLGPDAYNKFTCARFVASIDPNGDRIPEWRYLWRQALTPGDLLETADWGPSFRRVA